MIRHGYRMVSIQQIVTEAGVAKQTLYRRWPSKAELVLDAFLESADSVPVASEGSVEQVLQTYLRDLFANLQTDGPAIRSLIASSQEDSDFLESFRSRFVLPRARIVTEVLRAACGRGELSSEADLDTAVDALHGAFWYRLLQNEPLDAAFAERLARFILRGLGAI